MQVERLTGFLKHLRMGNPTCDDIPKAKVTTDRKFINDALKTHNDLRARHGSPPMVLKEELCKIAQAWANQIARKGCLEHSTSGYGENIYWSSADCTDARSAVEQWYSEIKDFNWNHMDWQRGTGHFTQVIWKESTELGIAKANGSTGSYVVANYNPGGNMMGDYPDNVSPPKK